MFYPFCIRLSVNDFLKYVFYAIGSFVIAFISFGAVPRFDENRTTDQDVLDGRILLCAVIFLVISGVYTYKAIELEYRKYLLSRPLKDLETQPIERLEVYARRAHISFKDLPFFWWRYYDLDTMARAIGSLFHRAYGGVACLGAAELIVMDLRRGLTWHGVRRFAWIASARHIELREYFDQAIATVIDEDAKRSFRMKTAAREEKAIRLSRR